jgi:hypothetical protein
VPRHNLGMILIILESRYFTYFIPSRKIFSLRIQTA